MKYLAKSLANSFSYSYLFESKKTNHPIAIDDVILLLGLALHNVCPSITMTRTWTGTQDGGILFHFILFSSINISHTLFLSICDSPSFGGFFLFYLLKIHILECDREIKELVYM